LESIFLYGYDCYVSRQWHTSSLTAHLQPLKGRVCLLFKPGRKFGPRGWVIIAGQFATIACVDVQGQGFVHDVQAMNEQIFAPRDLNAGGCSRQRGWRTVLHNEDFAEFLSLSVVVLASNCFRADVACDFDRSGT
jgi:hypothetical protein